MTWIDQTLEQLADRGAIGYGAEDKPASEPTALAALALFVHERIDPALKAAVWLADIQHNSGMVGVRAGEESPGWPTSLAITAWTAVNPSKFRRNVDKGIEWLLANRGQTTQQSADFGHNTELIGWSYAEQTHSWVEPTAFAVLALKAAGKGECAAVQEGVSILFDRQLPGGGLNYGNTYVLGQLIRSHVQPTGIGMMALAGEPDRDGRIAKSIAWLKRNIGPGTTPQSLAWGLLGLRAHGADLSNTPHWLDQVAARVNSRDRSPYKLALLTLAAKGWPT